MPTCGENGRSLGEGAENDWRNRRSSHAPPPRPSPPTPPDGGWGWMIVMSSFMISVLVDGVCFSMGIFFNPFRQYFHASKAQTSWVGSVLNGAYLSVGPLVSALVNRYGCRRVAMVGSLFAAASFFISTFSSSMPTLIVTYGLLGGVGFGLCYLPAIVMVGYYFERRRALATGIACCGSGIGAFVFAPLCNFLLEAYGWKGATWILSGLVLNGFVFSLFYRPLEADSRTDNWGDSVDKGEQAVPLLTHEDTSVTKETSDGHGLSKGNGTSLTGADLGTSKTSLDKRAFVTSDVSVQLVRAPEDVSQEKPALVAPDITIQLVQHPDDILKTDDAPLDDLARDYVLVTSEKNVYNVSDLVQTVTPEIHAVEPTESKAYLSDFHLKDHTNPVARMAFSQDVLRTTGVRQRRQHRHLDHTGHHQHQHHHHLSVSSLDNPLRRSDIFYSGSLHNLPEFQSSGDISQYRQKVLGLEEKKRGEGGVDTTSDTGSEIGDGGKEEGLVTRLLLNPLRAIFDVTLLKSPTFVIYGLSCFLCMLGFFVPFMYLPTVGQGLGIASTSAAFLISIIGIANTVGRVVVGFVSDQPWADCLLINNVALIAGGLATCLVPYFNTYSLLAAYSFVFGSAIAVFVSLRSIIMVELMGLERLTNAFGLVIMCQGISSFIGAPIAGFLSDVTGDYNISFYLAGAVLALGGVICLPLRRIARWENERLGLTPVDIQQGQTVEVFTPEGESTGTETNGNTKSNPKPNPNPNANPTPNTCV